MLGTSAGLSVLVVDDEQPALEELGYLLRGDDRVETVIAVDSAPAALRLLETETFDAVFLDIAMPGLSGLDLARVVAHFRDPPVVVFVTAHEQHAVEAFEINAVDYLLKPLSAERIAEAVRRIVHSGQPQPSPSGDETIPVELGGVTRFVQRSDVQYVESHGDYVRLHTAEKTHLLRTPLHVLQEEWRDAGFVRIHRQCLVSLRHVDEVKQEGGRYSLSVGGTELVVSRRHSGELRDLLVRRARGGP